LAKIMVVDDAAFMRMKCVKLLTEHGYDVVEADTGAQALVKYREDKPDAVLLDITMPDMDGLEALREIKKIDPHARIAMLTALDQKDVTQEAAREGADLFVVKPFTPVKVLATVDKLLRQVP